MKIEENMRKYWQLLLFLFIALLYLLFPTTNSTNDAYAYAAYIKYGHTLAEPFHLLYNYLGFAVYKLFGSISHPDALAMMKALNSIAAVVCLFLLSKILNRIGVNENQNMLLVLLCAFSFGVWRFATESETYILPIVFSLLASLHYLTYLEKPSAFNNAIVSFWASVACLFHVIHVFWWIGLLAGVVYKSKKTKSVILYLMVSLILPISYLLVVPWVQNCSLSLKCLWSFFSPVLTSGNVQYNIGFDNFYLSVINFFRTFYQIHGHMLFLLKKNFFFILPALISAFLGLIAIVRLFKKKLIETTRPGHFVLIHILIFVLQLLWAVYSKGNTEFMVMLPFLLAIIAAHYLKPDYKLLRWLVASFFIWNLSYGILPNHFADFNKREKLLERILKDTNNIYILEQGKEVDNQIFYRTGQEDNVRIMKLPESKNRMDSIFLYAKSGNIKAFTDYYNQEEVISRYSLTRKNIDTFMRCFKVEKADTFVNFYGVSYIYQFIW